MIIALKKINEVMPKAVIGAEAYFREGKKKGP